jgi:hypothetical protein
MQLAYAKRLFAEPRQVLGYPATIHYDSVVMIQLFRVSGLGRCPCRASTS